MARKPRIPASATPSAPSYDPATTYARDVIAGRLAAGPIVRDACARHMRDLAAGLWTWDLAAANNVISFFADVLRVDNTQRTSTDEPATVPFVLLPWQCFIIGSLFGWKGPDGFRRFRTAYIETGKGSGKSPLAAGIGLYCLLADKEPRAEVYAAASSKDQAMVLFRDAVSMARGAPKIAARVTFSGGEGHEWNIAALATGSFMKVIAAETAHSGPRPHCALIDEVHEHADDTVIGMVRAGTKGRKQALMVMITNSGANRTGVCWGLHVQSEAVCAGTQTNDAMFCYVAGLDKDDDPFADESCWAKANPSLGITFGEKYLRELVTDARGLPSNVARVLRLNFCVWTDAVNPWIDLDRWESAERQFEIEEMRAYPCFMGLDLSAKRDLTAAAACWQLPAGRVAVAAWFWTPGDNIAAKVIADRVPYDVWIREGHVFAPPGRIVDYDAVAKFVQTFTLTNDVRCLAFDQALMDDFVKACERIGFDVWIDERPRDDKGIPTEPDGVGLRLVRHGQGFAGYNHPTTLWMPRSINDLEQVIIKGDIDIRKNPCLRWNSASAVLATDASGSRKWEKNKSNGRIDGMIATSQAVGLCLAGRVEVVGSIWDRDELWG